MLLVSIDYLYRLEWVGLNWTAFWVVLLSSFIVNWIYWSNSRFTRLLNAIPGPPGIPVLGNVFQVKLDPVSFLQTVHREWVTKYGNIYRAGGFNRDFVCIASPELMEPILTSQKLLTKGQEYSFLSRWLGACMFLTTGARWRTRRRLLTPAFHFQILESFFDVFNERSLQLVDDLETAVTEEPSTNGTVNVYTILTQCALDIICDSSMGRQVRKREENRSYLRSVDRVKQLVMERGFRPWLSSDFLFNLSSLGRENQMHVKILHDFTNKVIRDRREMLNNKNFQPDMVEENEYKEDSKKRRLAFLDLLIQASESETGENKLSDEDIREEVDTFMFAGHDTTATAMGWFLYCIARNPDEQKLLLDEVDDIFEDSDRHCLPQDAANLKYLECCIKESLRLYPSIPGILRTLTEDTQVGEYVLPAGLCVSLMIYGMHRNPRIFPDPDAYKPERFLPEQSGDRHPYAFIPFSAGPRNCIGQKYAMFELKVVLSWVLRKFEFSVADPTGPGVEASPELVLTPSGGIPLIVKHRRSRSSIA